LFFFINFLFLEATSVGKNETATFKATAKARIVLEENIVRDRMNLISIVLLRNNIMNSRIVVDVYDVKRVNKYLSHISLQNTRR